MQALTIYKASSLNQAIERQKSAALSDLVTDKEIALWRDLESLLANRKSEYYNGDDGNIWMIADELFLYQVSCDKPKLNKVRIVGILRQNETSKELVFDSEMFENSDTHQAYARKNNLLLA